MKPLIVVFCASLSAHAAQLPAARPQFVAPAPPPIFAAPPGPRSPAGAGSSFEDYFQAEAEFLAADESFQESTEDSAQRQDAAEARALAFNRASQLLQQLGRREFIRPESWEAFALASERMRREAAPESLAHDLFNLAEIRGWLGFRISALRKLGNLQDVFEMARAAELFHRQASESASDSGRRAAYADVAVETWTRTYLLLDERLERFILDDAEDLAYVFGKEIHWADTPPLLREFYRDARREAWSAARLALIDRLLTANRDDLRAFRDKYVSRLQLTRLNSEEYRHCQRLLADIGGVLSDQRETRQRWLSLLRSARERGIEHFHPRDEALEHVPPRR